MLKAHSRLLEQLMLVGDLVLVAALLAPGLLAALLRGGPAACPTGTCPRSPTTCCMLLPILVVWGVAFRAFDLYRPRRLGSHLSEAVDIAKASTLARSSSSRS